LEIKSLRNLNIYWRDKFREFKSPLKYRSKTILNNNLVDDFDYAGYYDALAYLTDDILVKVDRASMSVSLESRAPFLDKRLIEFIVRLPDHYKYSNGTSKRILKDILYKYVPEKMVNRPKQGFAVPIGYWLRNELFEWANQIICNISIDSDFWDKETVMKFWNEHLSSKYDHGERLWSIIILEVFFMNHMCKQ
jgi:asparagine synthase (glutamine-hydrolysing)